MLQCGRRRADVPPRVSQRAGRVATRENAGTVARAFASWAM
jgi:hypothetical protein